MMRFVAAAAVLVLALGAAPRVPWEVRVDSRTQSPWIAAAPGRFYALQDAHPIAIDAETGMVRWRSDIHADSAPAARGGIVVVPVGTRLLVLDGSTGGVERSIATSGPATVVAGTSAIVALVDRRIGAKGATDAIGIDVRGKVAWKRTFGGLALQYPVTLGGNAVGAFSGGTFLAIDARDGHAMVQASAVSQVVGSDGHFIWFTLNGGGLKGVDLWSGRQVAFHGAIIPDAVKVEHGIAVAVIDGRLSKVDIASGTTSPLHIDGRWIGGPIVGRLVIERGDGTYLAKLSDPMHAIRASRYLGGSHFVGADRGIAIVGRNDGSASIIDVANAREIGTVPTGCVFYEGLTASGVTSALHCDRTQTSVLIGFDRVALTGVR